MTIDQLKLLKKKKKKKKVNEVDSEELGPSRASNSSDSFQRVH